MIVTRVLTEAGVAFPGGCEQFTCEANVSKNPGMVNSSSLRLLDDQRDLIDSDCS